MFDGSKKISRRGLLKVVAASICACLQRMPCASAAEKEIQVRYFAQSYSPALRQYLSEVVTTMLDRSVTAFGPYQLQPVNKSMSPNRVVHEVARGNDLDISFSSSWTERNVHADSVINLNTPVFFGLLGLRCLIVQPKTHAVLERVRHRADLAALSFGQGAHWSDTALLQKNGFNTVEAQGLQPLFPMLSKGRFDALPLSILEAEDALAAAKSDHPQLQLSPHLVLFYPMPFQLLVNPSRPALAGRLDHGLKLAMADGSLQALFNRHFLRVHEQIQAKRTRLVVLPNPMIAPAESEAITSAFLDRYGRYFDRLMD